MKGYHVAACMSLHSDVFHNLSVNLLELNAEDWDTLLCASSASPEAQHLT
jgi:hypothetical protein